MKVFAAEDLCPCSSGRPFGACCSPYAAAPILSGEAPAAAALASLRHQLFELFRRVDELQELLFACLDTLPDEERETLEHDTARMRIFLDHFLWDWFRRYSEARPISRIARSLEGEDLRTASRLDDWSLSPWEPWLVLGREADGAWHLRRLGSDREHRVRPSFEDQIWHKGDGLVLRLLPHLGHDFAGRSVRVFAGAAGVRRLTAAWQDIAHRRGVPPSVRLRPDVHNEPWLPIHQDLFALPTEAPRPSHRPRIPPPPPVEPAALDIALPELGNQSPREAVRHTLGRHRVRRWLDRRAESGENIAPLKRALGLQDEF